MSSLHVELASFKLEFPENFQQETELMFRQWQGSNGSPFDQRWCSETARLGLLIFPQEIFLGIYFLEISWPFESSETRISKDLFPTTLANCAKNCFGFQNSERSSLEGTF